MTAIMKLEGKFSFIIYSEDFLHTTMLITHKYAYKEVHRFSIISVMKVLSV